MLVIKSINKVPIRLTSERWNHIISSHPEMKYEKDRVLETLINPDLVQEGDFGELIAVKHYNKTSLGDKYVVVIYKETGAEDGFVVTAYLTRMFSQSRRVVWRP